MRAAPGFSNASWMSGEAVLGASRTVRQGVDVGGPESRSAAILGEILEKGGRIAPAELKRLVKRHGYDPRTVGTLHGKRLAHLRRDRRTGESVLTARGKEVAEQHLFARRLAEGARGTES